jgi:hypothetical protein
MEDLGHTLGIVRLHTVERVIPKGKSWCRVFVFELELKVTVIIVAI